MQKESSSSVKFFYPNLNRDEVIERLAAGTANLNRVLPLLKVVLFGSYAKNKYTVASDIDLLLVYRGSTRDDAFLLVRKYILLQRLEPHIYSKEEYCLLKANIERMVSDGIVIMQNGRG